jgi:signal transduction histidine kinase
MTKPIAQPSEQLPVKRSDQPQLTAVRSDHGSRVLSHGSYALIQILGLAAVYFVLGRLGLSVATIAKSVTLVWPSAGVSLVALLLFGFRLWPGVALGAFLVNALTPGVPVLSAVGIAVGNTLEAVLGVYLLQRAGFRSSLERVRDVVMLAALAAGLSTNVSATFGSLSLWLGGLIPKAHLGPTWRVWWLGDLMGDLIVAPLLLTAIERDRRRKPFAPSREAVLLFLSLLAISLVVFGAFHFPSSRLIHPYVVFPVLLWAALRYRVRGAAGANFVVSCTSVWATVSGIGPFSGGTLGENLFQVQTFMALAALTSLLVGAAAAERLRAIRVRDQFLSMASHELKTPLTPLRLQIHLLRLTLEREPSEKVVEHLAKRLAIFDKQVDRIAMLVDELLDISRVQSGQLVINVEKLDLGALVRETIEAFSQELALAGCSIDLRVDGTVTGSWDRLRIQQVVSNLLTNAMKYGGGRPIFASVASDAMRNMAIISVSDRGIGIPEEQQNIIFEAFERGSYAPRVGGLGLGLYIVSKIVEAHGGSIKVSSKLGVGSTFTVELPVQTKQTAAS